MAKIRSRSASLLAALASGALLLVAAAPVYAGGPAFQMDLAAGLACPAFDLRIEGYGDGQQVSRDLPGGRILGAGTGFELVFTNLASGKSITTKANGAASVTTTLRDGSSRMALTGHNVVILFPADGGPSTTLYVGRVSIGVATDGVWTVGASAGASMDVCAAVS